MALDRRHLLHLAGAAALSTGPVAACGRRSSAAPAEHRVRIAPGAVELTPGVTVRTTLYNDKVPGPLRRLTAGRPATLDNAADKGFNRRTLNGASVEDRAMAPILTREPGRYQTLELDVVTDNPGRTLFHCHQQLHMDFGFMALFDYA